MNERYKVKQCPGAVMVLDTQHRAYVDWEGHRPWSPCCLAGWEGELKKEGHKEYYDLSNSTRDQAEYLCKMLNDYERRVQDQEKMLKERNLKNIGGERTDLWTTKGTIHHIGEKNEIGYNVDLVLYGSKHNPNLEYVKIFLANVDGLKPCMEVDLKCFRGSTGKITVTDMICIKPLTVLSNDGSYQGVTGEELGL